MKKLSIITPIVFLLFIILTFSLSSTGQVVSSANPEGIVNFHIIGCTDCSNIGYCLDGAGFVRVGQCDFSIKCNDGKKHKICIRGTTCSGSYLMGVSRTFACDDTAVQDIYISCTEPCNCECAPGK